MGEPHHAARPGFVALIRCPNWDTFHFVRVDEVDHDGWVRRGTDHKGEAFDVKGAVRVGNARAANLSVAKVLRELPGPYWTAEDALADLEAWKEAQR